MAGRIVSTFSLLLMLAAAAMAGPYQDLDRQLKNAHTEEQKQSILQSSPLVKNDPKIMARLAQTPDTSADDSSTSTDIGGTNFAAQVIELRALAESPSPRGDVKALATEIKRNPIYTDPGEKDSTNWLGRALERLRNLRFHFPQPKGLGMNPGIFGDWIIFAAWFLLGGAVLLFLFFGLRRVDFGKLVGRARKKSSLLEDEEPDRTLDEWLLLADQLESEGRYREAIRSLYLACLLKFDESRIARFDRGQTNWEHLARIESSPRRPAGLEFRQATQAFDLIWYGHRVNGAEDVNRFRTWYREIVDATRPVAA